MRAGAVEQRADERAAKPDSRMRLLLGIHDGQVSGINTYIEHVAAAAAPVGDVTLLVADDRRGAEVATHLEDARVRVVSLGMPPPTVWQMRALRLDPRYAARRLQAALLACREQVGDGYDVAHLNHPHLAALARPLARRVSVAAWYYPHSAAGRAFSTWQHSGRGPRSAALALKGVIHQRNDALGYRDADVVIAPTQILASSLRRSGINTVHSTPPARALTPLSEPLDHLKDRNGSPYRLLICAGDLGHPRKNAALALDALNLLARGGGGWQLELVGRNVAALRRRLGALPPSIAVISSGPLPALAVHQRMQRADLLLVPSRFEEWGFVAVEAALHGTPVVTLPVYPFAEMMGPPLSFVANGMTAAAYADAICAALESRTDRCDRASMAAARFGLEAAGRRLVQIWEESTAASAAPW